MRKRTQDRVQLFVRAIYNGSDAEANKDGTALIPDAWKVRLDDLTPRWEEQVSLLNAQR